MADFYWLKNHACSLLPGMRYLIWTVPTAQAHPTNTWELTDRCCKKQNVKPVNFRTAGWNKSQLYVNYAYGKIFSKKNILCGIHENISTKMLQLYYLLTVNMLKEVVYISSNPQPKHIDKSHYHLATTSYF